MPAILVEGRVASELLLPADVKVAYTTSANALQWSLVVSELCSTSNYQLTRPWAAAFDKAGHDGLWVSLRFSANQVRGLALFGAAGEHAHPIDPHPRVLRSLLEDMRLTVLDPPPSTSLTVVTPR